MGKSNTQVPDINELKAIDTVNSLKNSGNKEKALRELLENMTEKQRRLVILILTRSGDTSMVEMCRLAGYKVDGKNKMSSVKKSISGKLGDLFYEFGFTMADLVATGAQLMRATKVIPVRTPTYDDEGKLTGQTLELIEVPDWGIIQKQWKLMMEHGNHFPAKELNMTKTDNRTITLDVTDAKIAEIRKRTEGKIPANFEVMEDGTIN